MLPITHYLRYVFEFYLISTNLPYKHTDGILILQAKKSNLKHRPIGIGIQGLADLFIMMRLPFESEKSQLLNVQIFETIYYGALEASCELAQIYGPYETYKGSPVSKGVSRIIAKYEFR